jgi:hypothetical protein
MNAIVRIGDLDRDGREDVVARETATGRLWFYPGLTNGLGTRKQLATGTGALREITPVGDLTGNGYPDLLAVNPADDSLYLYPGRANATFGTRVKVGGTGWGTMSELAGVGDFDRDGVPDLVAKLTATGALYLYAGRPLNTLAPRRQIGGGWTTLHDLVGVGDFDRDGFTDLTAITSTGVVFRWSGNGTGLRPAVQVATGFSTRSPAF